MLVCATLDCHWQCVYISNEVELSTLRTVKSSVSRFSVSLYWSPDNFSPSQSLNLKRKRRKRKLKKHLNANSSKKVDVQTETPSVPSQSQGTTSPINAHHTGNAIKAEEVAISQANTSDSKASTDINLAECLGVHGESFEVSKKPIEENWTPVVARRNGNEFQHLSFSLSL